MGLLELNGLSPELLTELSYTSQLGRSLKNNLDSFEKEALLQDALAAAEWLDINPLLAEVAIDYRIKSEESIRSKYERCYPHRPVIKTFNDILGFRSCCDDLDDNFEEVFGTTELSELRACQFNDAVKFLAEWFPSDIIMEISVDIEADFEKYRYRFVEEMPKDSTAYKQLLEDVMYAVCSGSERPCED